MKNVLLMTIGLLGATSFVASACAKNGQAQTQEEHSERAAVSAAHEQVAELSVTSDGFVPAAIKAHAGHPVKLVVTRKTERTCATEIVIKDYGINKPLPLNVPVEVTFTPTKPGKVRYACAMDMIAGEIVVE